MTRKQKVLELLQKYRNQWVDGPEIQHPAVGGSEGTRRLRELRAEGYNIEKRHHPDHVRAIFQYRILMDEPAAQVRMFPEL